MAEPKREAEALYKKRTGMGRFLLLQIVNIVLFIAGAGALVVLHERYTKAEGRARAAEVARFELKRMTETFNYRLNELREELFHLYGEQSNLARVLSEAERERLIFYRRDHLAAYGILVRGETGEWEVQKYYLRETARKQGARPEDVAASFKETMEVVKAPGFGVKRLGLEPRALGAPWAGGAAGAGAGQASDAYAVAFTTADDAGKPFAIVGIFRPSYVFPFCKSFSEPLGLMPVNAYVLNDRGVAVCHSQLQNESQSFKDYSFYPLLRDPPPNGVVHYNNLVDNSVSAAVKKIDQAGLIFVVEAVEVTPWVTAVPYEQLGMVGLALFVAMLFVSILMSRAVMGRGPVARDVAPTEPMPSTDGLGVELGEFTKLRHELKELEGTVLEMQAAHAFSAGYQRHAGELPAAQDLAEFTVNYLGALEVPVAWLAFDKSGQKLHSRARVNWGGDPAAGFQLGLGPVADPSGLAHDAELLKKLTAQLGRGDLVVQPVVFGAELLGLLVLAAGAEQAARLEPLPQIAQVFAMISRVRGGDA
ncbi:MAG: hypothetical protein HY075_00910 [Deltaproteobacteria bacterium]|nr:hypothetical protein [Deltaproteobacteria bacterium]